MNRLFFLIALLCLLSHRGIGQTIIRGPYLQRASASSIVVRWRTDTATPGQVHFGLNQSSLNSIISDLNDTTEHEIEINGLSPQTKYYYSVGTTNQELASGADYYFTTSPLVGANIPFRVWIIGDAGTANINQSNVRDTYLSFSGNNPADLWIMLGDNAYNNGTDIEYQNAVFDMYKTILGHTVLWPAFGNHDAHSANSLTQSGVFYDIFSLPDNAQSGGVVSGTEAYYSFDYANVHFVCLNSHDIINAEQFDTMVNWLKNDLDATGQNWTLAFWHHPPYSKGSHNSDSNSDSGGRMVLMREKVLPVLESGGVDMVFSGHSHSYERSYLINGHYGYSNTLDPSMIFDTGDGKSDGDGAYQKATPGPAANEGTVYVVAGSSGRTGGGSLNHPAMFTSLNSLGSVILDFNGLQLDMNFIDDDAGNPSIKDYLTMIKGGNYSAFVALAFFRIREIKSQSTVFLEWKTYNEINNQKWLLQKRRKDEDVYEELAEIAGQGTTSRATYYEYKDHNIVSGQSYSYRLLDISMQGQETIQGELNITISFPDKIELSENFPNPFNSQTSLRLGLPETSSLDVSVYDQMGRKIKTLLHSVLDAGDYTIHWDGKDEYSTEVASAIYYIVARSNKQKAQTKVTLIR